MQQLKPTPLLFLEVGNLLPFLNLELKTNLPEQKSYLEADFRQARKEDQDGMRAIYYVRDAN